MVEYYDKQKGTLINIKKTGPASKRRKKNYKTNRLNSLGSRQRELMHEIVFYRGMSKKNIDTANIDERENILKSIKQLEEMQKQLNNITLAITALKKQDSGKEFLSVATETGGDFLSPEDILYNDRIDVGPDIWDSALIMHTKKARLQRLSRIDENFDIFFPSQQLKKDNIRKIMDIGEEQNVTIGSLYNYLTSEEGLKKYPQIENYQFLRRGFDL